MPTHPATLAEILETPLRNLILSGFEISLHVDFTNRWEFDEPNEALSLLSGEFELTELFDALQTHCGVIMKLSESLDDLGAKLRAQAAKPDSGIVQCLTVHSFQMIDRKVKAEALAKWKAECIQAGQI